MAHEQRHSELRAGGGASRELRLLKNRLGGAVSKKARARCSRHTERVSLRRDKMDSAALKRRAWKRRHRLLAPLLDGSKYSVIFVVGMILLAAVTVTGVVLWLMGLLSVA